MGLMLQSAGSPASLSRLRLSTQSQGVLGAKGAEGEEPVMTVSYFLQGEDRASSRPLQPSN